jgi:catechol 2,3-dioxygenase-like lactoylglutathione lyase family enzyme
MSKSGIPRLTAFSVVFTVTEVTSGLDFLVDRLGFVEQFRTGNPTSYAIADRGAVSIQLMSVRQSPDTLGRGTIYVFVSNVDALHQELMGRGCPIELAPFDTDYGMREMSVRDPDGNRITFGEELGPQLRALAV